MRALLLFAALVAAPTFVSSAAAQSRLTHGAEREIAWRHYAADRAATVRTFVAEDERRPNTIVVDDRASNGAPITDDAVYVAEVIGRELGVDPTMATFVFRYTPAAFAASASNRGKTLLLRATFRRLASGALGSPDWRVITSDALQALTDRAMR